MKIILSVENHLGEKATKKKCKKKQYQSAQKMWPGIRQQAIQLNRISRENKLIKSNNKRNESQQKCITKRKVSSKQDYC